MSLAILFHFLCAQHVSDINISIIRRLWLFCWITTFVVLFLVRCVLEFRCASACNMDNTPTQPHRNSNTRPNKNNATNVVIQQNSRKLLMMDILMSEICWAHKKWNKIASDIKLVFYSSIIHLAVCLTTRPNLLPKPAHHILRYKASTFKWEYPLLSLRSSSSFLRLLPRLPFTSIPLLSFLQ